MRIPIDYDRSHISKVRLEALRLYRPEIERAEIWRTSPGNLRLVLVAALDMKAALELIQKADCDPDYKYWTQRRRDITERLTPKEGGSSPQLIEVFDLTPATWPRTYRTW